MVISLKVEKESVISPHTFLGMWLHIHAGIEFNLD